VRLSVSRVPPFLARPVEVLQRPACCLPSTAAPSVAATQSLEANTRSKKTASPPATPTSHPKGTPRTGLRHAEMEIGKWRPETGARKLPRKGRNAENYRSETGIHQRNPRECRRFSPTGKYHRETRLAGWGTWIRTKIDGVRVRNDRRQDFWLQGAAQTDLPKDQ
jgi:hypothetical protein